MQTPISDEKRQRDAGSAWHNHAQLTKLPGSAQHNHADMRQRPPLAYYRHYRQRARPMSINCMFTGGCMRACACVCTHADGTIHATTQACTCTSPVLMDGIHCSKLLVMDDIHCSKLLFLLHMHNTCTLPALLNRAFGWIKLAQGGFASSERERGC